jgi:biopolymer transport protein ExbB
MHRLTFVFVAAAVLLVACGLTAVGWAQEPELDAPAPAAGPNDPNAGDPNEAAGGDINQLLTELWLGFKTKWELGGITMWALAALAIVGVYFSLDRLVSLRRGRIVPRGLADEANRLWEKGDYKALVERARRSKSTLGRIIVFLVTHRNNSYEHLTTTAEDIAGRDFERHEQGNYPLNAVGTVSPLLGLLGTVFGLLGAFATIGVVGSMDDPGALAGDIGEALITTAAGLIVAIPTLILYHYFSNRTTQYANILGEEVSTLMQDWFLTKSGLEAQPKEKAHADQT